MSAEENSTQSFLLDCPICLQKCVHPVELPCTHIFCFLCIKGVAMQGVLARCAICRTSIPSSVLTHPTLKDVAQLYKQNKEDQYEWFYEARGGGWWQYDERTMQELEKAYQAGSNTCQLLVVGHLYEVDFAQMIQYRSNNRNMIRRVKRDLASVEKRGIAGISFGQAQGGNAEDGVSRTTLPNLTGHQPLPVEDEDEDDDDNDDDISTESNSSDEGVDSDHQEFLEGEEDEDDMELVEEELLEESEDEQGELRDGARAPTSRSNRSNSSITQTPPPNGRLSAVPSSSSPSSAAQNGSSASKGRRKKNDKRPNSASINHTLPSTVITKNDEVSSSTSTSPSPHLTTDGGLRTRSGASIRLSPDEATERASSNSSMTTSSLTCLLIAPGVRITVDPNQVQAGDNPDDIL